VNKPLSLPSNEHALGKTTTSIKIFDIPKAPLDGLAMLVGPQIQQKAEPISSGLQSIFCIIYPSVVALFTNIQKPPELSLHYHQNPTSQTHKPRHPQDKIFTCSGAPFAPRISIMDLSENDDSQSCSVFSSHGPQPRDIIVATLEVANRKPKEKTFNLIGMFHDKNTCLLQSVTKEACKAFLNNEDRAIPARGKALPTDLPP